MVVIAAMALDKDGRIPGWSFVTAEVDDAQSTGEILDIKFGNIPAGRYFIDSIIIRTLAATAAVDIDQNRAVLFSLCDIEANQLEFASAPLAYYQNDTDASGAKLQWLTDLRAPFIRALDTQVGLFVRCNVPEADSAGPTGKYRVAVKLAHLEF